MYGFGGVGQVEVGFGQVSGIVYNVSLIHHVVKMLTLSPAGEKSS